MLKFAIIPSLKALGYSEKDPFYDSATLTWKTSDWLDNALASENQGIVTARDRLDELMPLCSLLGLFCLSGNACKGPKFTRNSA